MLSDHQIDYPRVNDLDRLLHLLEAEQIPQPPGARQLGSLTPWATHLRYEDPPEPIKLDPPEPIKLDRPATITLVNDVADWPSAQIPR